ncbi:hypothetical protein D3C86_1801220 [compost metagenome]
MDRIERIAVDHRAAGAEHGVIGDGVEGRIGQHQRHPGALLDPELVLQGAGEGDDLFGQLAETGGVPEEIEGDRGGIARTGGEDLLVYRPRIDRNIPKDALRVAGYPGTKRGGGFKRGHDFLRVPIFGLWARGPLV